MRREAQVAASLQIDLLRILIPAHVAHDHAIPHVQPAADLDLVDRCRTEVHPDPFRLLTRSVYAKQHGSRIRLAKDRATDPRHVRHGPNLNRGIDLQRRTPEIRWSASGGDVDPHRSVLYLGVHACYLP